MSHNKNNNTEISSSRKILYYAGFVLMGLGLLLFVSNFFMMGTFDMSGMLVRSLSGMGLMGLGSFMQSIGRAGLAGSGVLLDPKRAREDLKPHTTAIGGMFQDALEGMDENPLSGKEVVKVRCPNCKTLNDEEAKFCDQCGQAL